MASSSSSSEILEKKMLDVYGNSDTVPNKVTKSIAEMACKETTNNDGVLYMSSSDDEPNELLSNKLEQDCSSPARSRDSSLEETITAGACVPSRLSVPTLPRMTVLFSYREFTPETSYENKRCQFTFNFDRFSNSLMFPSCGNFVIGSRYDPQKFQTFDRALFAIVRSFPLIFEPQTLISFKPLTSADEYLFFENREFLFDLSQNALTIY